MTTQFSAEEMEREFRNYYRVGIIGENWPAWSKIFTDDAVYYDHFYGTFRGPKEIELFLETTMGFAPHVYTVLVWYQITGNQITWKGLNRADNPQAGGPPIQFPSLQIITYAGDGKWSSEEDWWIKSEMIGFVKEYEAQSAKFDPDHRHKMTRNDWGPWVDWARPEPGHIAKPSWVGRTDLPKITSIKDMNFGERPEKIARGWSAAPAYREG
jgi:hypothetical protein